MQFTCVFLTHVHVRPCPVHCCWITSDVPWFVWSNPVLMLFWYHRQRQLLDTRPQLWKDVWQWKFPSQEEEEIRYSLGRGGLWGLRFGGQRARQPQTLRKLFSRHVRQPRQNPFPVVLGPYAVFEQLPVRDVGGLRHGGQRAGGGRAPPAAAAQPVHGGAAEGRSVRGLR